MQQIQKKIQASIAIILLFAFFLEPIFQPQFMLRATEKAAKSASENAEKEATTLSAAAFLHNNLGIWETASNQENAEKAPKPALPFQPWAKNAQQVFLQITNYFIVANLSKAKSFIHYNSKLSYPFLVNHLARAP